MARSFASTKAVEDFYQSVSQHIPENPALANVPDIGVVRDIETGPDEIGDTEISWAEIYRGSTPIELDPLDPGAAVSDRAEKVTLSDEEASEFDGRIRIEGFDCLAFYKSRRYRDRPPYPGRWGIFYLDRGIRHLSDMLRSSVPALASGIIPPPRSPRATLSFSNTREWAYWFLREHERYHFRFDLYAMSVEAVARRAMYERLGHAFRRHPSHLVEEALANAAAYDWARRGENRRAGLAKFARDFMRLQPHAYARFEEPLIELKAELAANLLDLDLHHNARRRDQAGWVAIVPPRLKACPEYLVHTPARTGRIRPALQIPAVRKVVEGDQVTKHLRKNATLNRKWETTKEKLCTNPAIPGLNFKPWDATILEWSVKVDEGCRAHLRQIDAPNAVWQAIAIGTHTQMEHD